MFPTVSCITFLVLISIKNLRMTLVSIVTYYSIFWPPKVEGHDVTENRLSP